MSERDAIVAWLRDDAGKTRQDLRRMHASRQRTPAQTAEWESMIMLKSGIADAIERGDHMPASVAGEVAIDDAIQNLAEAAVALNVAADGMEILRPEREKVLHALQAFARHRATHAGEVERLREALAWYGEQARLARLIHSGGDAGRHALADDGGKRARQALEVSR